MAEQIRSKGKAERRKDAAIFGHYGKVVGCQGRGLALGIEFGVKIIERFCKSKHIN
jgi:hypothetical protein